MRRSQRLMSSAVLISLCGVLAGCGGGGLNNWDPTDMLNFLDTKKKMPGNRQPVFPGGVPGIEPGVPKDLYRGDAQSQQAQEPPSAAAPPTPDESGQARRQGAVDGSSGGAETAAATAGAAAVPRKPKRLVHRRATSLPKEEAPAVEQAAPPPPPAAQQSEPAASPFPAPLPSGSFAR